MNVGLLWFDEGNGKLAHKVKRAAKRYHERFGQNPNICYVHPEALSDEEQHVGKILLKASSRILRNHLWVGYEQSQE